MRTGKLLKDAEPVPLERESMGPDAMGRHGSAASLQVTAKPDISQATKGSPLAAKCSGPMRSSVVVNLRVRTSARAVIDRVEDLAEGHGDNDHRDNDHRERVGE